MTPNVRIDAPLRRPCARWLRAYWPPRRSTRASRPSKPAKPAEIERDAVPVGTARRPAYRRTAQGGPGRPADRRHQRLPANSAAPATPNCTATCRSAWASGCSRPTRPHRRRTAQHQTAAATSNTSTRSCTCAARAARSKARASGNSRAPSSSCSTSRCAARRRTPTCSQYGTIDLEGVQVHGLPARQRGLEARGRRDLDRPEDATRHGPRRAHRVPGRADLLYALDFVSRSATSASPACCSRPSAASSNTGTQIAVPYYWNIAPNYDATLHHALVFVARLPARPGVPLPDRAQPRQLERRISRSRRPDRRIAQLRRLAPRHALRIPRTRLLIDAANVSDNNYFEDFGVGFEGTSVDVRRSLWRPAPRHRRIGRCDARAQDYQVIDRDLARRGRALPHRCRSSRRSAAGAISPGGLSARVLRRSHQFPARPRARRVCALDAEPSLEWRVDRHGAFFAANAGYRLHAVPAQNDDAARRRRFAGSRAAVGQPRRGLRVRARGGLARASASRRSSRACSTCTCRIANQDDLPVFDTGIPGPEPGAAVPHQPLCRPATGSATRTRSASASPPACSMRAAAAST